MKIKISEKSLFLALFCLAAGSYLAITNTIDFSAALISEKRMLLQLIALCLTVAGIVNLYRSVKKA